MGAKQKKYATIKNPSIDAVVNQLFRLPTRESAIQKLEMLKERFVVSKQQGKPTKNPSVIMWIKGYEVSKKELEEGYLGHFALVTFKQAKGKYTLYPTKIASDLKVHPQRKYEKRSKHPNWGHPILRAIKQGKTYETAEEVKMVLGKLHEEYPDVTIPATGKLYVMIFSREGAEKSPVQKYVLEMKVIPEGGFKIECRLNTYKSKPRRVDPESRDPDQQKGYFTAMVSMKRSRKKPK